MGRIISSTETIEREISDLQEQLGDSGWIVEVFNNVFNTWVEVIGILMVATQCDYDEAFMETWEVHHLGRSVVHHADEEECQTVAMVIRKIGIHTEVRKE